MRFFEFLCPDKSPQNARMPKREKTKNIQNEQPTHTPHPHHKKHPRSFAKTTIAHSKFLMCNDAKFPHTRFCTPKFHNVQKSEVSDYLKRPSKFPPTQQSTPKFHNAPKSEVSDYLKRPSKFPPMQQSTPKFHNAPKSEVSDYLKRPSKFPPTQQSTPKFHNAPKSEVSDYLKRPSKFPYTHEVREFLTIQRPNAPRPNTHTTPPKPFGVSDSLQNPPPFKGKFHTLGSRPIHRPRHRGRAVIRLCACRKMPNTLADANLP